MSISTTSPRAWIPGGPSLRWRASSGSTRREIAEVRARLGVAAQLDALCQTDHAIEQLRQVVVQTLTAVRRPRAGQPALGEAQDRLGNRDAAVAAYRAAVNTVPSPDPHNIRQRAAEQLDARRTL